METAKLLIQKSILIKAPKEKVWDVLFTDPYIRIWYNEFSVGCYAVTDWKLGSKAVFKDDSESGLIGEIVASQPNELLSIEYTGVLQGGVEDFESEMANQMKGGRETYKISDAEGGTFLEVDLDIAPEYFEMMSSAWDNAIVKIKELSEN
ncbi:SRPBCC domain-containing protein [Dyadobacter subterraneus]|uniref:SRPBCC domain-containing protein n=1 Tax=Dyadobacter subterraneus TaxID=2773304 RepID=A0ABR9W5Z5_9BACT|nr:SRPBCC domain-containing protein [Dyadobacter subterraneus]MBE9460868.1 SRPBCC domain-containing protein [Dyadobacter subterraneus]